MTEVGAVGVPPLGARRRVGLQRVALRRLALPALVVLCVGLGVVVGWFVRQSQPASVNISSATAYSTPAQITVSERGWSYEVALDTPWRTADGVWNLGSRPACLPPTYVSQRIKFAWVKFDTRGTTDRRVVWVECP